MSALSLHLPVISFEFKAHIFPKLTLPRWEVTEEKRWGEVLQGGGSGGVIENITLVIKTKSQQSVQEF